jgi:ATP-binding cassette subfamily B protein
VRVLRSCRFALAESYRSAPVLSVCAWVITLVLSVVPAAQVLLVSNMTDAIVAGDTRSALLWAVLTAIAVAGLLGLQQVMYALQRMTQIAMTRRAMAHIGQTSAGLRPSEISDPEVQARCRAAREAILEGGPQMQATSAMSAIYSVLVSLSLFAAVARINPWAALLVFGCLLPMTVASVWYARRDTKAWPVITEARRRATYREEQITYQSTALDLSTYDARGWVAGSADEYRGLGTKAEMWLERASLLSDSVAGLASSVFLAGALVILILGGGSSGSVAGGAAGILSGISATASVGFVIGSLNPGANATERYRSFVSLHRADRGTAPVERIGRIDADDVRVRYPRSRSDAVHGATISVRSGEIIAVVGANGAGKTTLAKAISGMIDVDDGSVRFDDTDVTSLGFDERHVAISQMSQEFGRYEFTVRECLELGAGGASVSDDELWCALRIARADRLVEGFHDGLDQQLGEQWDGVGLSGGQWQRLALARTLLRGAGVWILDEPTSAIDAEAEEEIFDELRKLPDRATILISHRAWTLKKADRIYVMQDGAIVEQGTFDELSRAGGRFQELFRSQLQDATGADET